MIEERLTACEARLDAQFSLLMALYQLAQIKGLVTPAELEMAFNAISTRLQRALLDTPDLPEDRRRNIDAHLAEIGKLRHHLEV
jgi:hypothetical protein